MVIVRTGVGVALNSNIIANPGANGDCMVVGYMDDEFSINPLGKPSDFIQYDYQFIIGDGGNAATLLSPSTTSGNKTFQSAFEASLCAASYSGVDQTTPVNANTSTQTAVGSGTLTGFSIPTITTTVNNCTIIVFVAVDPYNSGNATTYTVHGGNLTKIADISTAGATDWTACAMFEATQTTAGSTAGIYTLDVSYTGGFSVGVFVMALAPTPADNNSFSISWTGLRVQTL